jgi:Na+-transporting NADH:ubiquinone oxidoreductase subunit NqrF
MSYQLIIYGRASQKIIKKITLPNEKASLDLLTLLREEGIPIASSCDGEGVCHKCLVNSNLISCQITLLDFLKENEAVIDVDYL